MEKRKLLLAEGNEEFALALEAGLRGSYTVRVCRDGQTALHLMRTYRPDILVLDMMLPGLDGISLLQSIADDHMEPMVLTTSRYYNDYILENLARFGVGYLIRKPCDVRATVARIGDLTSRICRPKPVRPDPGVFVSNMLREFRVKVNLKGFRYLQDSIGIMAAEPEQALTKELYVTLGKRHNTNYKSVERCIRTAIDGAWKVRDESYWRMYFSPGENGVLERPSNGEFIIRLVQRLNTELDSGD